jgi:hypothetical protein
LPEQAAVSDCSASLKAKIIRKENSKENDKSSNDPGQIPDRTGQLDPHSAGDPDQ